MAISAVLSFELKEKFRLNDLLQIIGIPESSYHYHLKQMSCEDPEEDVEGTIQQS